MKNQTRNNSVSNSEHCT